MKFKQHTAGKRGWSEWASPRLSKPYHMACCDCGLVHDLQFAVYEVHKQSRNGWWHGEPMLTPFRVLFRARRNERLTAQQRAASESSGAHEAPGLTKNPPTEYV